MSFLEFEHNILPRVMLPILGGLLLLAVAGHGVAQAAETKTFIIADAEGYGITECLTNGKACGAVVADAWCEAHGMGQAAAFGRADDVTGSISSLKAQDASSDVRPESIIVTCNK